MSDNTYISHIFTTTHNISPNTLLPLHIHSLIYTLNHIHIHVPGLEINKMGFSGSLSAYILASDSEGGEMESTRSKSVQNMIIAD